MFFQKQSIYSISRKKKTQRNVEIMQFEFSNINTQYNQADVIASITKENTSASKSNISSVYNSSDLNLDAAVLSISSKGSARINAMLSKSIQLRASSVDPSLTADDRRQVSNELRKISKEINDIRSEDSAKKVNTKKAEPKKTATTEADTEQVELNEAEAEKMIEASTENILKQANESLQTQNLNRDHVLQLL